MVIQITPHTEQVQGPPGVPGAEEAHKAKSLKSQEKGMGVFAKILAGLSGRGALRKTGTGENAADAEIPGKIPLAEAAEPGKLALVSGGKEKNARAGKTAATGQIEAKKPSANSVTELELSQERSKQEKNILFAVGRIAGQPGEQDALGEVQGERAVEGLTADSSHFGGESEETKAFFAALAQGKEANSAEKQPLAANAAGEPAINPKSVNEAAKAAGAKNRLNPAETGTQQGLAAGEYQRVEAKKASVEKDGPGRLEEARSREKRRGATFEVRDFRTGPATTESVSVRNGGEARVPGEAAGKDIVLELRLPNQGQEASEARTTWDVKAGQAFEDLLARELHQNFNNDIVRHASVALRDGGEGTIRLALKPESLGNVKIHLEMAENKIAGRIVVESVEALRALEREISSLEKAFLDSGFEGANLEMSLAADGREAQQQWQEAEASQFLPGHYAASRYDAAVDWMEIPLTLDVYQQGARAVNVLV